MHIRKQVVAGLTTAIVLAFTATRLLATTVTVGGVTLDTPSYTQILGTGLLHCEPWNDPTANVITLSGVPDGSNVALQFVFTAGVGTPLIFAPAINLTNVGGDPFTVTVPYPTDPSLWPYQNGTTHSIIVAVSVVVTTPTGAKIKIGSRQWKITCIKNDEGDNGPFNGCSPGYWKNLDQHLDSWIGYTPDDHFDTVFGVTSTFTERVRGQNRAVPNPTLIATLELGGGGEMAMGRFLVNALLNLSNPGVNFHAELQQNGGTIVVNSVAALITLAQNVYANPNQFTYTHGGQALTGFEAVHYALEDAQEPCPLN